MLDDATRDEISGEPEFPETTFCFRSYEYHDFFVYLQRDFSKRDYKWKRRREKFN